MSLMNISNNFLTRRFFRVTIILLLKKCDIKEKLVLLKK